MGRRERIEGREKKQKAALNDEGRMFFSVYSAGVKCVD